MNKRFNLIANNWFWVIAVFSFLLFAGMLFFQVREKIVNNPITNEGVAYAPVDVKNGIDLCDDRELFQEFIATEREITSIYIGFKNLRDAEPASLVSVGIYDGAVGVLLKKSEMRVADILPDDYTKFQIPARLLAGRRYWILIKTNGVETKNSLSVYYEPKINSLPENVQLSVKNEKTGTERNTVGHIGFKISREPTPAVVWENASHDPRFFILLGYALLILFTIFVSPARGFIRNKVREEMNLGEAKNIIDRWEVFCALFLGIFWACVVTVPFYLNLNKMDSMGDVQRNLLFRALGRESLLKDGAIAQWDPYTCGGAPLLANIESAHTDPFFFLSLVFGENIGLRLSVTLALALGFWGTYLLARRFLGANRLPTILAAAIYSFSGFQMLAFSTGVFAWIPAGLIPLFVFFFLLSLKNNIYLIPAAGMLAWIFLGGGPHMPVFSVILISLLAVGIASGFRSGRPLVVIYLVLVIAGLFSAVKLLPAAELVVVFDNFNRAPSFIAPLSWITKIFIDRHQDASLTWNYALTGENYRWAEFGGYVGIVPVLLFLFGLPFIVRKKITLIWFFVGLVVLVMVFGFFPWTVIHQVPVLKEIVRNPQRLRSIFFLPFGLLCAYALTALSEKFIRKILLRKVLVGLVVLFVIGDLLAVNAPNFYNLFNLAWPKLERQGKFVRLNGGYTDEDTGYYKAGYLNYLANEGTTDLCVPNMAVNRPMMSSGKGTTSKIRPYRGEAYFLASGKKAEVVSVSPTKIIVRTENPERDEWLVLNQNFFPGWKTEPKREVGEKNGLVAARIKKGDARIIFEYSPPSFRFGFWISLISVIGFGGVLVGVLVKNRYSVFFAKQ